MASLSVESDDIEFIDGVDDEAPPDTDSQEEPRKAKRRKNQILCEHLKVDPNDNMVKELLKDRLEWLKSEKALRDTCGENKSVVDDLSVQELREDRRKALMERDRKRKSPEPVMNCCKEEEDEHIEMNHFDQNHIMQYLQAEMINKDKSQEESDDLENEKSEADEYKEADDEKDADENKEADDDKEIRTAEPDESEEESFCTMKSDLYSGDSHCDILRSSEARFYDCKSSASQISMLPSQDTPLEEIRENITEDTGAKPKKIVSKTTDTDDAVTDTIVGSPGALKNSKDEENIGLQNDQKVNDKEKIKQHKKNMSLDTRWLQVPNGKLDRTDRSRIENNNNNNKEIIITLTTAEGVDKDPALNDTLDQSFDDDAGDASKRTTDGVVSGESPLNSIGKMSDDSSKTSNSLLAQKEVYQKSKAKPFKDLQRLKVAILGIGIEGDQKRSYVKTITIMPDQKLVVFDRNNKCLKLFDKDFNPLDRVHIGVKFCGLTTTLGDMVAATMPDQKMLQFFHINNVTNKIQRERTHDIEAEFYSVSHYKNRLFLLQRLRNPSFTEADEWQIVRLDLNKQKGRLKQLRAVSPGHQDCSLLATEYGVYITNKLEGEVLLLKHDGTFKYRHKVELSLPVGLTSDRFGNVYICGGSVTSFIEVCKPDIKRYKLILSKTSIDPVAMCYDKRDNFLYVCDKIQGKIIKYKIEHSGFVHSLMKSFVIPPKAGTGEE